MFSPALDSGDRSRLANSRLPMAFRQGIAVLSAYLPFGTAEAGSQHITIEDGDPPVLFLISNLPIPALTN